MVDTMDELTNGVTMGELCVDIEDQSNQTTRAYYVNHVFFYKVHY